MKKKRDGRKKMDYIETKRLYLRKFEKSDWEALLVLLQDEEVNTFLPWFPLQNMEEVEAFYEERLALHNKKAKYYYAICLKEDNVAIGYVKAEVDDSHDFGYALRKEYWHQGITSEASKALVEKLKQDGVPYITATHDRENPRSGAVMQSIGMKYCYSYEENWQPKNKKVTFRMYQLNLDGNEDRVYQKYWINMKYIL